jgi:acyl carrier protein
VEADEIAIGVSNFLVEECGLERASLEPDTPLFSSGRLDSLDIVRLAVFIETRFGIALPPLEVGLENFDTIARVAALVMKRWKH